MKLLQSLFSVFTFSISTVSFEFSDTHYGYVKSIEPQDRGFIVLGLLALEEKYGDSTNCDPSNLSINYVFLNELVLKIADKCKKSQFESFPKVVNDLNENFFLTFTSDFWNLDFKQNSDLLCIGEYQCDDDAKIKNYLFAAYCFHMNLNVDLMQLYQINKIHFSDSLSCLVIDTLNVVTLYQIENLFGTEKRINCKKIQLNANNFGLKCEKFTIEKAIKKMEFFLSIISGLECLEYSNSDYSEKSNLFTEKLHALCLKNNVCLDFRTTGSIPAHSSGFIAYNFENSEFAKICTKLF